jgi:hypothetical protein
LKLQNSEGIEDSSLSEIRREFQHMIDLQAQELTDEQLATIWPPWNALPPDMIPELKGRVLRFDENNEYLKNTEQHAEFEKLRCQFQDLPLDRHKFNQAVNLAV